MKKQIMAVFMAAVLCLASIGCGTGTASNLVTALNAVSDAASVAVVVTESLVSLGKIDQATADQVSVYATNVGTAVNTSLVELNTSDTNPQKIDVITVAFAKAVVPAFGANAPQITAAIDVVQVAVKIFLNQLSSTGVLKAAKAAPTAPIKLASGDKATVAAMKAKVATTLAKAAALKVKK